MFTRSSANHPSDYVLDEEYEDFIEAEGLSEDEFTIEDFWEYLIERDEDMQISEYEYRRENPDD